MYKAFHSFLRIKLHMFYWIFKLILLYIRWDCQLRLGVFQGWKNNIIIFISNPSKKHKWHHRYFNFNSSAQGTQLKTCIVLVYPMIGHPFLRSLTAINHWITNAWLYVCLPYNVVRVCRSSSHHCTLQFL